MTDFMFSSPREILLSWCSSYISSHNLTPPHFF